jgi:SlyX protein
MTRDSETRITELELLVTHLQRDLEALNSVVLEQQKQLDRLGKSLDKLDHQVEDMLDGGESRDPLAERPPHY